MHSWSENRLMMWPCNLKSLQGQKQVLNSTLGVATFCQMSVRHMSKSSPKTSKEKQCKSQKASVATERLNDTTWPSGAPSSPARWKFMASFICRAKLWMSKSAPVTAPWPRDTTRSENHSRFRLDLQKPDTMFHLQASIVITGEAYTANPAAWAKHPKESSDTGKIIVFLTFSSHKFRLIIPDVLQIENNQIPIHQCDRHNISVRSWWVADCTERCSFPAVKMVSWRLFISNEMKQRIWHRLICLLSRLY